MFLSDRAKAYELGQISAEAERHDRNRGAHPSKKGPLVSGVVTVTLDHETNLGDSVKRSRDPARIIHNANARVLDRNVMPAAIDTNLVFTISLKRSTQILQVSTSSPADYPIF